MNGRRKEREGETEGEGLDFQCDERRLARVSAMEPCRLLVAQLNDINYSIPSQ